MTIQLKASVNKNDKAVHIAPKKYATTIEQHLAEIKAMYSLFYQKYNNLATQHSAYSIILLKLPLTKMKRIKVLLEERLTPSDERLLNVIAQIQDCEQHFGIIRPLNKPAAA